MRHRPDRASTFHSQAQSFCPRPKVRQRDKFGPGPNSPLPTSPTAASCPPHPPRGTSSGRQSGRSSGVEHNLAKVGVEGSNPFARSRFSKILAASFAVMLGVRMSRDCRQGYPCAECERSQPQIPPRGAPFGIQPYAFPPGGVFSKCKVLTGEERRPGTCADRLLGPVSASRPCENRTLPYANTMKIATSRSR